VVLAGSAAKLNGRQRRCGQIFINMNGGGGRASERVQRGWRMFVAKIGAEPVDPIDGTARHAPARTQERNFPC